ncbi:unnamed protein product [Nyctereutes procyonoides]|uniref:(raccoon dog) hypothetical protein n=1 Tax=Nyctereutes procyonoides TaxID=34880 RepID=A0A811ZCT0_NYCPR|nr:unnamed protein product [Nyctereutes procyonoides]
MKTPGTRRTPQPPGEPPPRGPRSAPGSPRPRGPRSAPGAPRPEDRAQPLGSPQPRGPRSAPRGAPRPEVRAQPPGAPHPEERAQPPGALRPRGARSAPRERRAAGAGAQDPNSVQVGARRGRAEAGARGWGGSRDPGPLPAEPKRGGECRALLLSPGLRCGPTAGTAGTRPPQPPGLGPSALDPADLASQSLHCSVGRGSPSPPALV